MSVKAFLKLAEEKASQVFKRKSFRRNAGKRFQKMEEKAQQKSFLEVIRVGFFITFSHFEEYSVNDTGDDSTSNRSDPVNPLVRPCAHNNSGSK